MKFSPPVKILILFLLALLGWNYWLPAAKTMYMTISSTNSGDLYNVDFFVYYNTGARFIHGEDPYFFGKDSAGNPRVSDYLYPPTVAPVFGLLALLPYYDQARLLWIILYGLSYLGILVWMVRSFSPDRREAFLALSLLLTLVSYPLLTHILHGQVDVFIISLMLACYLAYARRQHLVAAILLAVATAVKVSPIFLLFYFVLFRRDGGFLLRYAGALAVLFGLSLIVVPIGLYGDYLRYILPEISRGSSSWLNQSIIKYLTSSTWLARLASVGGLAILAAIIWQIGRRYTPAERQTALPLGEAGFVSEAVFILNLAGTLIFLGKAWSATYVWLILPSAWLVIGLLARQVKPVVLAVILAGIFLTMAKVYGFAVLNSLELWGNMLLTACLAIVLLTKKLLPQPGSDQPAAKKRP